ncbi:hypothetical protein Ctob_010495 [Chrysochromulina tobinii]|uniref:Uncharacterized protein n=1 Tax=Chrysochromulina tobinii TaxID=1460289 RepID=A0A0M0JVL9_9EUKA|nr:hypothetical protein Ctob_010495 [Chrysochromulina tobinii]|eukprot:KOO30574.1 hypothetical protein Ctob_010495 [Chrysochromulina sp. CCMP291]
MPSSRSIDLRLSPALGTGLSHRVCTRGFLSLYQPLIGESGCEPVGSTRTSSARGRVAGRTPIHRLVEEKVARLGGAEDILRAAKAGLQLRLVHINVVSEADLVRADERYAIVTAAVGFDRENLTASALHQEAVRGPASPQVPSL